MDYHKLLTRQIKKYFSAEQLEDASLQRFLSAVNDSYTSFERDKEIVENAFIVSETEYKSLYYDLTQEHELKKLSIERLKQAVKEIDAENEIKFNNQKDDLLIIVDYLNAQILKRKESENSLSRALKLLTTLLSNLNSGILVEDENRKIQFSNQLFSDTFSIPATPEQMRGMDCSQSAEQTKHLFTNPEEFVARIDEILTNKTPVFKDVLHLVDGRVLERDYIPIYIENEYKGHLWDYADVTERKTSEDKLLDLSTMQNAILNGTDYSIIYADTNGLIKSFNRGAEKMLGYKAEEMIDLQTPSVFHDEGEVIKKAKDLSKELGRKINPGFEVFVAKSRYNIIDSNEWTYVHRSGRMFPVQLSVSSIRNQHNEIVGFLGIARDISEQKYAQEALRVSEERYRNIVEKSTDIIYKTDKNGYFTYVNPVAEKITGFTNEELLRLHYTDLIKPEKRKSAVLFYKNQIKEKKNTTYYEFPILTKSGEEKWIGQSVQFTELDNLNFELTALAIDITERINYEKTILIQKEKYQNIIANMNLGLLEVDLEENIQYANPNFTNISGFSLDELINHKATDLFVHDYQEELIKEKKSKRSNGISDMYEIPVKNKKGEMRWWMISGAPNYDDKGKLIGSIGIHLDITEKKQLEFELELAKSKAEESSKAKESFLANMSHEIRTPLNAIIGMIRELSKEELSIKQNHYVYNTSVASQHLLSVLNNILDISKIEAGELQLDSHHFNLVQILNDVKAIMMVRATEKNLYLKISHHSNKNLFFIGDSSRLRQVFLNLIGNAIKFTHSGGVTVDYDIKDLHSDFQAVYITITDTGVGMEESYLKNIFNKFSQEDSSTSRKYGGSGLGMAITNELIQLMNGAIDIKSKKNVGTTINMKFLLPVGDPDKVESDDIIEDNLSLEHAHILLVEDNEFNRAVACNALNYYKCKITEAVDGKDAIDKINAGGQFDIILMDLQMPIMDGFETTRVIRNELEMDIPIIALTANAFKSELEQCIKTGMNDYITKPFEEEKLIALIAKWLNPSFARNMPIINELQEEEKKAEKKQYNLSQLVSLARNDMSYVKKMVHIFIDQSVQAIEQIKSAYEIKNLEEISKIAHRIRPSIEGLGIDILKTTIRELESMCKEGKDSEEISKRILFLNSTLQKIIEDLKQEKFE